MQPLFVESYQFQIISLSDYVSNAVNDAGCQRVDEVRSDDAHLSTVLIYLGQYYQVLVPENHLPPPTVKVLCFTPVDHCVKFIKLISMIW